MIFRTEKEADLGAALLKKMLEETGFDTKNRFNYLHRNSSRFKKGITVTTFYLAKGLEFDHVWIPDCNEKTFPHGSSREPEHCEEERRIFYVAMTRAKKDLELLCLTGTRERPRFPSRFLIPLNRYHR